MSRLEQEKPQDRHELRGVDVLHTHHVGHPLVRNCFDGAPLTRRRRSVSSMRSNVARADPEPSDSLCARAAGEAAEQIRAMVAAASNERIGLVRMSVTLSGCFLKRARKRVPSTCNPGAEV